MKQNDIYLEERNPLEERIDAIAERKRRIRFLDTVLSVFVAAFILIALITPAIAFTGEGISFYSDKFSIYAIVGKFLERKILASDGRNYNITVTFSETAGIPEDAELEIREIVPETGTDFYTVNPENAEGASEYDQYVAMTEEALGREPGAVVYARFFDISIVKDGEKLQPAEGSSVDVRIVLADKPEAEEEFTKVVHFGEESTEVIDAQTTGQTVNFETSGFSVYAIVEAPDYIYDGSGWVSAGSIERIAELGSRGLYMNYKGYYLLNRDMYITKVNGIERWGIVATTTAHTGINDVPEEAAKYHFVPSEIENQFYIYVLKDGMPWYVRLTPMKNGTQAGLSFTSDETQRTSFTLEKHGIRDEYLIYTNINNVNYYWNRNTKTAGFGAFVGYSGRTDANTAWMSLLYYSYPEADPYNLDQKSFGITYFKEEITATALSGEELTGKNRAAGLDMLVRPDIQDNEGILLVAQNADITQWTFESAGDGVYRIKTPDGRYLAIDGSKVSLAAEPSEYTDITVKPGIGKYAGKYQFSVNGYALNLPGKSADGFNAVNNSGDTTWMSLAKKSDDLRDESFVAYSAHKISVSEYDPAVHGNQVVLYTRVWNELTKRYEFYAVDAGGALVRCYESGDVVEWVGGEDATALWSFVEYTNEDGSPSYYYDLRNAVSGQYIAPQLLNGQTMKDGTIGVHLNGRRYGDDYTTIIAWDQPYYEFAGLKTENGRLVSCPLSEAQDFYFAVLKKKESGVVTTVETVNNDEYGISMRMVDFNGPADRGRNNQQTDLLGFDTDGDGLVRPYLAGSGYPDTNPQATGMAQGSLSSLFSGGSPANHLFIQSTYNESGYFEFDSTQNFAYLGANTDFTVYDQLATIETISRSTEHGQFMPYNWLVNPETGETLAYSVVHPAGNMTNTHNQELPDTNPRKGEPMYGIPYNKNNGYPGANVSQPYMYADYFFGMELEASFTQTPSGLDAWGHDIIFEFSGDDDFWLFVDDMLVLDLGGVHSAVSGDVNFRTGAVNSRSGSTTLRQLFEKAYRAKAADEGRTVSDSEVTEYLDSIFVPGGTVFQDYSNHRMKVFYMERGAGASNLHMRFNLAAVKPGTVVLEKNVSGTDKQDYLLAEFPYQIRYKTQEDGERDWHLLTDRDAEGADTVTYTGRKTPVTYRESYIPAGGSAAYESVFFLKPGQSAQISLPEKTTVYEIVECGVNSSIYDAVAVNGQPVTGEASANAGREDFRTGEATIASRLKVEYDNHVNGDALRTLTIKKILYAEDGVTELSRSEDPTGFSFRLYLWGENESAPKLAEFHGYHIKNENGEYCVRDAATMSFASLGKTEFSELTAEEQRRATFTTSQNGSISEIPAKYSVEVPDVLVGSHFLVEERDGEIPEGYARIGYAREEGSYIVGEGDTENSGVVRDNSNPVIDVLNRRGFGLTVKKVWSDAGFMADRDPVYFAVYVGDSAEPVPGTVRRMSYGESSLYYYFDSLQPGCGLADYHIYEVTVEGAVMAGGADQQASQAADGENPEADGAEAQEQQAAAGQANAVAGYTSVTKIADRGTVTLNGVPKDGASGAVSGDGFTYTVTYEPGEATGSGNVRNVRTDTVANSRMGIELIKTDWNGNPLPGAVFALTDEQGRSVGDTSYRSAENGRITIAYLTDGTYTLRELSVPSGYRGLMGAVTITVSDGGSVYSLSGADAEEGKAVYTPAADGGMPMITVKNRPLAFYIRKTDENGDSLADAHFALYAQVQKTDGTWGKASTKYAGFEDLVSGQDGMLYRLIGGSGDDGSLEAGIAGNPEGDGTGAAEGTRRTDFSDLPAGTYYLAEIQAPKGYQLLGEDIVFTVGIDGKVERISGPAALKESLTGNGAEDGTADGAGAAQSGTAVFTLTVENVVAEQTVRIKKTDVEAPWTSVLAGAEFNLYRVVNGKQEKTPLYEGLVSGEDGFLALTGETETTTEFTLETGSYALVETKSPDGYNRKAAAVTITIDSEGVSYKDPEAESVSEQVNKNYREMAERPEVYELVVTNTGGYELPSTGGPGTAPFRAAGTLFTLGAGILLMTERRLQREG